MTTGRRGHGATARPRAVRSRAWRQPAQSGLLIANIAVFVLVNVLQWAPLASGTADGAAYDFGNTALAIVTYQFLMAARCTF